MRHLSHSPNKKIADVGKSLRKHFGPRRNRLFFVGGALLLLVVYYFVTSHWTVPPPVAEIASEIGHNTRRVNVDAPISPKRGEARLGVNQNIDKIANKLPSSSSNNKDVDGVQQEQGVAKLKGVIAEKITAVEQAVAKNVDDLKKPLLVDGAEKASITAEKPKIAAADNAVAENVEDLRKPFLIDGAEVNQQQQERNEDRNPLENDQRDKADDVKPQNNNNNKKNSDAGAAAAANDSNEGQNGVMKELLPVVSLNADGSAGSDSNATSSSAAYSLDNFSIPMNASVDDLYTTTDFYLPVYCPDGNASRTYVLRYPPEFPDGPNRSKLESEWRASFDENRCFGAVRGIDYSPGRDHDLQEVRSVSIDVCLDHCYQKNAKVDKAITDALMGSGADKGHANHTSNNTGSGSGSGAALSLSAVNDAINNLKCAATVYNPYTRTCFLKKRGELQKRLIEATSFVLGLCSLPLRRPKTPEELLPLPRRKQRRVPRNITVDVSDWKSVHPVDPSAKVPEISVLYGILSEHFYVKTRLIPSMRTWLKEEHVSILLVESNEEEKRRSEELLAPFLAYRATPSTVRVIQYLVRNSLDDLRTEMGIKLQKTADGTRKVLLGAKGPGFAREAGRFFGKRDERLETLMQKYGLKTQIDRGEYRLVRDSGAWKDLPGLQVMFQAFKNYSFYMVIDDDSYIIQRNFEILLSSFYVSKFNPWNTSVWAGVLSVWYQPLSRAQATMTPFIQGGGGILLSHHTVAMTFPLITKCRFVCDYLPHGDVRLGCCLQKVLKIDPTYETTFWHMHIYRAQGRDHRTTRSMFPVSFHRIKNGSMMDPLETCTKVEEWRMKRDGVSRAAPVTWQAIERCYQWMRGTSEHEYKFQMNELH